MGIGRNQYIDLMNQYRSKVYVHTPVHVHVCTCTCVHNLSVINVHVHVLYSKNYYDHLEFLCLFQHIIMHCFMCVCGVAEILPSSWYS